MYRNSKGQFAGEFDNDLCAWCDAPATHNMDSATDRCCGGHYAQHFAHATTEETVTVTLTRADALKVRIALSDRARYWATTDLEGRDDDVDYAAARRSLADRHAELAKRFTV